MGESRDAELSLTIDGLEMARWVLVGLLGLGTVALTVTGAWVVTGMGMPQRLWPLALVLALWGASGPLLALVRRSRAPTRGDAGAHLLVDALALTLVFACTGGAENPFTALYFLPITLATLVSPRWTWVLGAVCLAGFAALFLLGPAGGSPSAHAGHGHHDFGQHVQGMWIAFGVAGVLITAFVHRIAVGLQAQRHELARLRDRALEDRHLAALGTLAAGAAHELGTPLGTIQVLMGELPHLDGEERIEALADVRQALRRCKDILGQMASPELRVEGLGERVDPWPFDALRFLEDLSTASVEVRVEPDPGVSVHQHRDVVGQVLRELVANGVAACERGQGRSVVVTTSQSGESLVIEVTDDAVGIDDETRQRATEPFFTTGPEGEGHGLGLYLARAHVRQLGGDLELLGARPRGTIVRLRLPTEGGHE